MVLQLQMCIRDRHWNSEIHRQAVSGGRRVTRFIVYRGAEMCIRDRASAVGALGEASYTVTANVTDSAGNSNSASHNVQVNTALPASPLIRWRATILLMPPNRAWRKLSVGR